MPDDCRICERGIWILDNASPLRQASNVHDNAYLFEPADAYRTRPGSDQGTPLPPEEAQMPNPPNGAMIDYYVRSASTPLVIRITDASGHSVRQWSSTDKPPAVNPKSLDITMSWVHPELPPSAEPGAHRRLWDFTYSDNVLAPPGRYTVQLRVNGKTYTQSLMLRRDPSYPANDADLRAQYRLAERIQVESAAVEAALERARTLVKQHPRLRAVIGQAPLTTPDDPVGKPAQDFNSLRYVGDALESLQSAVESADSRPTPDQYAAFATLKRKALNALHDLAHQH